MSKLSEKGVASVLILLLLVVGLAVGLYLVQNRTNLLPKAYDNRSVGVETSVSCVPGKQDTQTISARWNDSGAASYQVEVKEPGGTVGLKCVGKETSYTFEGEYSTAKNFTAYVYAYPEQNCGGVATIGTAKVSNAVCTGETADSFCKPLVNSSACGQPAYDFCTADCDGTQAIYKCTPKDYKYTAICSGVIGCAAENRRCDPRANKSLDLTAQTVCIPGSVSAQIGATWQDNGAGSYQMSLFAPGQLLETKCVSAGTTSYQFRGKYQSTPNRIGVVAYVDEKCNQLYPNGAKVATINLNLPTCTSSATSPTGY